MQDLAEELAILNEGVAYKHLTSAEVAEVCGQRGQLVLRMIATLASDLVPAVWALVRRAWRSFMFSRLMSIQLRAEVILSCDLQQFKDALTVEDVNTNCQFDRNEQVHSHERS